MLLIYIYDDNDCFVVVIYSSGCILEFVYQFNDYEVLISLVLVEGVVFVIYIYMLQNQVVMVIYVGGGVCMYYYENQDFFQYLIGIIVEDGCCYSIFIYDFIGCVIFSQYVGGVDGVMFVYSFNGGVVVIDVFGWQIDYILIFGGDIVLLCKVIGLSDLQGIVSWIYYDQSVDFCWCLDIYIDCCGIQIKYIYVQGIDLVSGCVVSIYIVIEVFGLFEQWVVIIVCDVEINVVLIIWIGNCEICMFFNVQCQLIINMVIDIVFGQICIISYIYCEVVDVVVVGSCLVEGLLKSVDGLCMDVVDVVIYIYYLVDDVGCVISGVCIYCKGDLCSVINVLGQMVEILVYDVFGRLLLVKDVNGVVIDYIYYFRGWLIFIIVCGVIMVEDWVIQLSYWLIGQVQKIIELNGSSVFYFYDVVLCLIDIEDNVGNMIYYMLDNVGNCFKEDMFDVGGMLCCILVWMFNMFGQLIVLKDVGNYVIGFVYDVNGNLQMVIDVLQCVISQQYDLLNCLVQILQDVGGVVVEICSQYNVLDQVMQVIDLKGLYIIYVYNGFGDLIGQVSLDSGVSSFIVDVVGNCKIVIDVCGVIVIYYYDVFNCLIGIVYLDFNLDVGYSYDVVLVVCVVDECFVKGCLGQVLYVNGSIQYCYDCFGQVICKVQIVNGVVIILCYVYSKLGCLIVLIYFDGSVVDYVCDIQGCISQIGLICFG